MQINDLARRYLIKQRRRVRTPIDAKQLVPARPRLPISSDLPINPHLAQAPTHDRQGGRRPLECPHARVVAAS